ncbi:PLC-like phosphodiesterase [Trichoderma barbatum]
MSPLRWLLAFFVLGFASLAESLPLSVNKTLDVHTSILKEHGTGARNSSMSKRAQYGPGSPLQNPEHVDETFMILVNSSPYTWQRGYIHQYQMPDWEQHFPQFINPGLPHSVLIQPRKIAGDPADSAGEVEYHLVGTSEPMSFMVKYRNRGSGSLEVEFRGALSSMNNAKGSSHKLAINWYPGGSAFILAGKEGDFITNDPPLDWMQAMLPELKDKPLREIILPMSHHSGLWSIKKVLGVATPGETQTQTVHLRDQLADGGIRVLDFRPTRTRNEFCEVHGTFRVGFHGAMGACLTEIVQTINEFNRENPGELIILKVDGREVWNADHGFRTLDQQDRKELYKQFMMLVNLVSIPDNVDASQLPLGSFIGNKTSAVLVHVSDRWRMEDANFFPGSRKGFVTDRNFPLTHAWTDTNDAGRLLSHQTSRFWAARPLPQSPIHIADWVLTLQGIEVLKKSILDLAAATLRPLFNDFWLGMSSESYPNWVSVDNVRGNQLKTLIMAMNHCFVVKKCGDLGGRVLLP